MLLRDVEVDGRRVDVRVGEGRVVAVGRLRRRAGEQVTEGHGGALIVGLHDHHLHLQALAADRASVDCSGGLQTLQDARPGPDGWVRGVRARESVDRHVLDRLVPDVPIRVQHRSGGVWMLNSRALSLVQLDGSADVERDQLGEPTGRLWRYDSRIRSAVPGALRDLAPLGNELASYGLTSVTDATPDLDAQSVASLRTCPLAVTLLGDPAGDAPWKLLLRDHDLPSYDELVTQVRTVRPRPVAVHCVTRESLLLTLAVLDDVGRVPGDRIEHAAVVPDPGQLHGLTVVTQPALLTTRSADYRRDVAPDDLPLLYPYRSLLDAGVAVLPSSDAPYAPVDPWAVMRAARDRDLGVDERVPPATVLHGYQRGRAVRVGMPADLVLLHTPLASALATLEPEVVRRTWVSGHLVHDSAATGEAETRFQLHDKPA